ncbi:MAG: type VI secretion system protein TssA [Pseudomonas sp.]|uniref:type VI secretion system protein TssA n=1 Tax=Pseudomonas sp. TaxID=306 RepID=UPI003397EEE2
MNLADLLEPIEGANPGGVELDYDPRYQALESSVQGKPERQYGTTLIPAEEPDWSRAYEESRALLARSKDLRLAVILTRALTRMQGIEGAVQGLEFCLQLAQRFWDSAFPPLEFDGEYDPLPRSNALTSLVVPQGLLSELRNCQLGTQQMGALDISTLERIANAREDSGEFPLRREQLEKLLRDEAAAGNPFFPAIRQLKQAARALDRFCQERLGAENAPSFLAFYGLIDLVYPEHLIAANEPTEPPPVQTGEAAVALPPTAGAPALPGVARTRAEAIQMLDAVCDFLETHEPASPAPLLIKRARKLIGQDFLSILRELAPDGLAQAELIAGVSKRD